MGQRFSPGLTSFSAGEVGPLTYGRADLEQYNMSLRQCNNWIPAIQGPLVKRKGSKYIAHTAGDEVARLIPYTATNGEHFMLEFSTDDYSGTPGTGTINIYAADGTDTGLSLSSPYAASSNPDMRTLQYAQKEDLLFIAHERFLPHVFVFNGTSGPVITAQVFNFGPLGSENLNPVYTLLASGVSGTITISELLSGVAHGSNFTTEIIALRCIPQALHDQWVTGTAYAVGDYVWSNSYESDRVNVYKATNAATSGTRAPGHDTGDESDGVVTWTMVHSEYGFVRITGITIGPPQIYDCEVVGFPEIPIDYTIGNGQSRWSNGLWSASVGPPAVTFHEQRVIYGGSTSGDQFIHGSKIDEFTNFYPGSLLANAPYKYAINSSQNNDIRFLESARSLLIGTDNGVFAARASSGGAITPVDIVIERDSNRGSKQQQPVQVGESVLFVQNGGATLREIIFTNDTKGFAANDLSIMAHHIGEKGLNRVAFQNEPNATMWTFDNTGVLIGMTYEREQDVVAWHQHNLAADSTSAAVVEEVATLRDENGVNDKIWMVVKRVINSATVRYIEIIDMTDTVWSDSYLQYSGASTTTITGLSHLEGETVSVIGDGAKLPDAVVTGGEIELAIAVTTADVGLQYSAKGMTQKIEGGAQTGISQGKSKRVENVVLRVIDAGPGLYIGNSETDTLQRVIYRSTNDLMGTPIPLFSGDTDIVPMEQNYEAGGTIYFEHNLPFDCTITAMWPNMYVEDAR